MTSTSFNVGLKDDTRLSSRVLRPPGGGHTDIFGGEPEPPRVGRRGLGAANPVVQNAEQAKSIQAVVEEPAQNGNGTPEVEPPQEPKHESPVKEAQAPVGKAEPEQAKADAPKRVRVPPGGFSSGLW